MVSISGIGRNIGRIIFDPKYQETVTSSIKARNRLNVIGGQSAYKDLHKNIADAFVRADKKTMNNPFWKSMKDSLTSFPADLKNTWKTTSGFTGTTKGIFKQFMKRMPLLGGLLMIGLETPNIISAFSDKGFLGGILETGKSAARLTGSMAGFVIGQALIPIPLVGGLIGGIAGDWLASRIVGKSHSEQKAEMEETLAQATQAEQQAQLLQQQLAQNNMSNPYGNFNIPQQTMTPQQLAYMQKMLYSGAGLNSPMDQDFMAATSGINQLNCIG